MKTEHPAWAPPLLALQFLTRIPVPAVSRLTPEQARSGLARAVIWFPLVGTLIGGVTAAVLLLAEQLWPRLIAVFLALIVEACLTGAFHEDAVADFCDGVGGGRNAEHTREIMKDSRIGTYGAVALMLAVGLRLALTCLLPASRLAVAVIAAATFGRLLAVMTMASVAPASSSNTLAKDVGGRVSPMQAALAATLALPGLAPLVVGSPFAVLGAVVAGLMFLVWFSRLLKLRVGGSTGDCLGFAAYAGQLMILLAVIAA